MRFQSLDDWLSWQETLHPQTIELGLARIRQVFQRLHPEAPAFSVISVAGTNGKGSTVALLEAIFLAAGYKTGAYISPHLLRYNERIRLSGQEATDTQICQAFERVDAARADISLTYFEFGTLAALDLFYRDGPDIVMLEVGLGGRLDAVNIIDSDVAVITAIGLDHTDWLGDDRESIAREKAGIMRAGKPAVCSDADIPRAVLSEAQSIGAKLYCLGRDFQVENAGDHWVWTGPNGQRHLLPRPEQSGEHQLRNAAGAMMVLGCLAEQYPVTEQAILAGFKGTQIAARQELIHGQRHRWLFDVAHNAQSAAALAETLKQQVGKGKVHTLVGILKDKDITSILKPILPYIATWHCVDLDGPRGASAVQLRTALQALSVSSICCYPGVAAAMSNLENTIPEGELLVVFGSFYTVAEALSRGV